MKSEFLSPRFEGQRFDQHTLPVDVARDLAAYEELVVELAKHLYRRNHGDRQRVPKGFEKEFSLHLERVDEGSAKPLLAWVAAAGLLLTGHHPEFEQARDLIAECVQATAQGQPLPEAFPSQLLDRFNVVGRSLREGESVDLAPSGSDAPAVLTPELRKKLVLAAQTSYEREVELFGQIEEVDFAKGSFRLKQEDGSTTIAAFTPAFESFVREAAGRSRTLVVLRGIGLHDAHDVLKKVSATEHLEIFPNHELGAQIEALAKVQDGWMDGLGRGLNVENLDWLSDRLTSTFPQDLPYPFVCPTPTGGVFLEWSRGDWLVSVEFPFPEKRCELQAAHGKTRETVDTEVELDGADSFSPIYSFVRKFA